jgi:hypothetical protein
VSDICCSHSSTDIRSSIANATADLLIMGAWSLVAEVLQLDQIPVRSQSYSLDETDPLRDILFRSG